MTQREKVVAHVAQVIGSLGVKSVRMDDVANSMTMSKRTLYEMFGDKEELLYEGVMHIANERYALLREQTKGCSNTYEVLFRSFQLVSGSSLSNELERRLSTNLKKFYPHIYERVQAIHTERSYEGLKSLLDKSRQEGLLDPYADIELMSRLFLTMISHFMSEYSTLSVPQGVTREVATSVMIINFMRGISSIKGLQLVDELLERERKRMQRA